MRDEAGEAQGAAAEGSFEERLANLAELVGKLEGGQLGLSESISAYERGVRLVRGLHAELLDVEQRVRMLTAGPAAAGNAAATGREEDEDDDADAVRRRTGSRGSKSAPRGAESSKSATPSPSTPPRKGSRRLPGMDDAGAEA